MIILAQFESLYAWLLTSFIPTMAIAYGLSYLGGLLFGQAPKEAAEDEPRGQSFAWKPHTTQQEGIAHPMCYGRNKHFGNVVARWTDVDKLSGNEILYKILDYGRGPVQGVAGGLLSDNNRCIGGTPSFAILLDNYIDNWYQTAADVNDADKTTYVGFYGIEAKSRAVRGRFKSEVTFSSTSIDRIEYCRYWYLKGTATHQGYEKVSLWYSGSYHLISTKNFTTEGSSTDTIVIEAGGPWTGVTKIKIEVELSAAGFYLIPNHKNYGTAGYRLYELRAWHLEEVPVLLNGQPAHNFTEVRIQGRQGTLNQTCMEGFEQNKLESRSVTLVVHGEPVRWTSPNNFFDDIEYTLSFPRGLFYYGDDGGIRTHSVGVKVEISERDAESWTTLMNENVSANKIQQVYKAYRVNEQVPASVEHGKQYDLKFTKTSEDKSAARYGDELKLRSIREVVDVAFTRPGKALLGITVEATERLQGDIDITWITDDRLVNVYDGETWEIEWTRNRAFIYLDMVTQPVISGDGGANPWVVERYEGLDPSRVDLAFIYKWAQWCDAQVPSGVGEETEDRMPCDIICDQLTNVWSIAYEIAQIGRVYPYWQGAVLMGWIDKVVPEDETVDLVTFDNIMLRSWKSGYAGYGEMAGNVEVFYKDALQGYERKSRPVSNANAGLYTRVVQLEAVGVTGTALAVRVGNHALNRNALIKNINSTSMYRAALRYKLGQVVRLQATVPNWGQPFRVVKSEAADTVEFDRNITGVFDGDILFCRTTHVTTKTVRVDSYTVESVLGKVVTIVETWVAGHTPVKNDSAAIGIDGAIVKRRIVKMRHTQENRFDVEFETYDATLYDSDGEDPGITNPDYAWPVTELAEPMTHQAVVDLINLLQPPLPKVAKPQLSNCAWIGDEIDTVAWSKRNADEPILLRWEGETYEITPGETTLEFIYWDSEYPTVFQTTAAPTTLTADYLVCTNRDGVAQQADMLQMTHGVVIQVGTLIAAQIIISGINALGLMNAPAEAGADVTGAHEADISLANLGEKSVDSLVNGTYAKMLANWRHGVDPTKMDLSLGFAASITTAQIGLLAVHTAQINNLAVETLKIGNLAVTSPKIASNAVTQEYTEHIYGELDYPTSLGGGTTLCGPIEITTAGGDVVLDVTACYGADPSDDEFWSFFRKDGNPIEPGGYLAVWAEAAWDGFMTYRKTFRITSLGAGTYEFSAKGWSGNDDIVVGDRFFTVREIKK